MARRETSYAPSRRPTPRAPRRCSTRNGEFVLRSSRGKLTVWDRPAGEELVCNFDLLNDAWVARSTTGRPHRGHRRWIGLVDISGDTRPVAEILAEIACRIPLRVVDGRLAPAERVTPTAGVAAALTCSARDSARTLRRVIEDETRRDDGADRSRSPVRRPRPARDRRRGAPGHAAARRGHADDRPRAASAMSSIDSGSVSRHHANLLIGAEVEVEDVGSSNGTFVDGAKLPANKRVRLDRSACRSSSAR